VLGNDADCAGLAEALFGAGKGLSPIFYITIGSGIGGGLIINGEIYRGCGRGAAEIGHLRIEYHGYPQPLEELASGWGMQQALQGILEWPEKGLSDWKEPVSAFRQFQGDRLITVPLIAEGAASGQRICREVLAVALDALAEGICHVVALACPRRFVIGGGVSLIGEQLLFDPLRRRVAERGFKPFADCYDIVPAALGEEVVVHGALALARKQLSGERRGLSPPSGPPG
jgi:glucokinase